MSKSIRLLLAALFILAPQSVIAGDDEPAQVMLIGVFHFNNPGLDTVKTAQIDVTTVENQAYLEGLVKRLAEFNPTRVLLEYEPSRDDEMQKRYADYLDGSFELKTNEIYQLGFRLAAQSAAETIHGFDHRSVQWKAGPMHEYMQENDQETAADFEATIAEVTEFFNEAHASMTLQELLVLMNGEALDSRNRGLYVALNHVGDADNYYGADSAASWWHRNFRMYANIQRHAQPGERVLVISGQGHNAIFKQLLADDAARKAVDVVPYL